MPHTLNRLKLSDKIAEALREEISQRYCVGQQLPAESELAKRFGVSVVSLREAVSILCYEGFVKRLHGSGTYVTDRSDRQHIAILAETDIAFLQGSHFYLCVLQDLQVFFRNQGMRVRLYLGHRKPDEDPQVPTCAEFLDSVVRRDINGVVAIATPAHSQWVRPFQKQGVPIVSDAPDYVHSIGHDHLELVRQGTRHLLEQGRRKIAWIDWQDAAGERMKDQLMQAFREVMGEYGAPVNPLWIRHDIPPSLPGAGWDEFREIWHNSDEKPDGLLICDDVLSRDASTAIAEMGIRVPEQLRVVFAANKGSRIFYPFPVDRMEYDPRAFAQSMGQMLLDLMQKKSIEPPHVKLPFEWVRAEAEEPLANRAKMNSRGEPPNTFPAALGCGT